MDSITASKWARLADCVEEIMRLIDFKQLKMHSWEIRTNSQALKHCLLIKTISISNAYLKLES